MEDLAHLYLCKNKINGGESSIITTRYREKKKLKNKKKIKRKKIGRRQGQKGGRAGGGGRKRRLLHKARANGYPWRLSTLFIFSSLCRRRVDARGKTTASLCRSIVTRFLAHCVQRRKINLFVSGCMSDCKVSCQRELEFEGAARRLR